MSVDIVADRSARGAIVTPPRRWRIPKSLAWAAVTPFAAWAVARVAGLERDSLTTQLMTGTPYVAAASLVPVLLSVLTRNRAATAVALITTAALGLSVLPRAFRSGDPVTGTPLRVLTLNTLFGHAEPGAVMDLVRRLNPDVLSTQELTPGMVEKLETAGLGEIMPYRVLEPEWSAGGSGLYSRYPLTPRENLFEAIGHNMPAALMTIPGAKPVEIVDVHPFPHWAGRCTTGRRRWTPCPPPRPTRSASSRAISTPVSTTRPCAVFWTVAIWTRPTAPERG